jgi:cytochrome c oxidase subunit 2
MTRQWEFRIRYPSPERMEGWKNRASAKADFEQRLPARRDDVHVVNDVHTWVGQKVIIYLKSRDVNHAFFVPVLRVKQDSMPGRTIPLWFQATESNTARRGDEWVDGKGQNDRNFVWDLVCTHYCGTRHSLMRGKLYVHPTKDDFLAWLKQEQKNTLRTEPEKAPEKVAAGN